MIVYTEEEFAALPVGTEMVGNNALNSKVIRYEDGWGLKDIGERWIVLEKDRSGLIVGGPGYTIVKMGTSVPLWDMS